MRGFFFIHAKTCLSHRMRDSQINSVSYGYRRSGGNPPFATNFLPYMHTPMRLGCWRAMNHNRNILGQKTHFVVTRLVGPSRWFSAVGLLKHRLFVTKTISTNRNYLVKQQCR